MPLPAVVESLNMETMQWGWWQRLLSGVTTLLILAACQSTSLTPTPTPPGIPSQPIITVIQPTDVLSADPVQPVAEAVSLNNTETGQQLSYIPTGRVNDLPIPALVRIDMLPAMPINTSFEKG